MTMSRADEDALKRLPDGWFAVHEVHFMVRNPRYRCDRLVGKGKLEKRIVGEWPNIETQWKKTP